MKITTSPFGSTAVFDPLPTWPWPPVAQGWQCPVCHTVYAPTVPACYCAYHAATTGKTSATRGMPT